MVSSVSTKTNYNPETSKSTKNQILYAMSVNKALNDKDTKKQKRITNGLFYAAPILDSVMYSALEASQTKSLAKTMGRLGSRLGMWGLLLGFYELASKGIDKLTQKSKTLNKLRKDQPELKALLDIGAIYGGFRIADNLLDKGLNKIPTSFIKRVIERKNEIAKSIDSSKIAKNIFTPALENTKSFMAKHVKLAGGIKSAIPKVAGILIFSSLIKSVVFDSSRLNNKIAQNYLGLKDKVNQENNI